jgi:hypothetical protein
MLMSCRAESNPRRGRTTERSEATGSGYQFLGGGSTKGPGGVNNHELTFHLHGDAGKALGGVLMNSMHGSLTQSQKDIELRNQVLYFS